MQRLRSPTPNRKGEYEVHQVPSRKAAALKARGWEPVGGQSEAEQPSAPVDIKPEPQDNAQERTDALELHAEHKGGPWYRITDVAGDVVKESAKRADVDAMGATIIASESD